METASPSSTRRASTATRPSTTTRSGSPRACSPAGPRSKVSASASSAVRAASSSVPCWVAGWPTASPCRSTPSTRYPSCATRSRTPTPPFSSTRLTIATRPSRWRPSSAASTCSTSGRPVRPSPAPSPRCPWLRSTTPTVMVFTSGTTGRPKGVVHTHASLATGIDDMVDVWRWSEDDRVVLVLPLNHVHGLVNVTLCRSRSALCARRPDVSTPAPSGSGSRVGEVTLFMAVPTIYARLVGAWEAADEGTRQRWSDGARSLRLMVSGSAALPVATLDRWEGLTGHRLLERYGMSELGMALTNSIETRVPGHVGEPFPSAEVRVVDEQGHDLVGDGPGELWVRGPQIFGDTGDARRPPRRPSPTVGSARATSPCTPPTGTASSAGPRWTSSRPVGRRSRRWRSRRSSAPTRPSSTAR